MSPWGTFNLIPHERSRVLVRSGSIAGAHGFYTLVCVTGELIQIGDRYRQHSDGLLFSSQPPGSRITLMVTMIQP